MPTQSLTRKRGKSNPRPFPFKVVQTGAECVRISVMWGKIRCVIWLNSRQMLKLTILQKKRVFSDKILTLRIKTRHLCLARTNCLRLTKLTEKTNHSQPNTSNSIVKNSNFARKMSHLKEQCTRCKKDFNSKSRMLLNKK